MTEVQMALNVARSLLHREDVQAWATQLEELQEELYFWTRIFNDMELWIAGYGRAYMAVHGPYRLDGLDHLERYRERMVARKEEVERKVVYLTGQVSRFVTGIMNAAKDSCISA